ncbi:ABC transporter substrate-binding protein [Bacteroidales bacterium OttesenSCG-928-M06]|nr:ABC transporter substrate-binding protein [Bacteroidales bacterium OttesenSCG-928-M06]
MFKQFSSLFLLIIIVFSSCHPKQEEKTNKPSGVSLDSIYYAKGFSIETYDDYQVIKLKNPWKTDLLLQTYILCPKFQKLPENLPEGVIIRTPLEKTVTFSSVTCSYLEELEVLHTLIGVAEPQYIDIPFIDKGIKGGKIQDIGLASNPDIEKLILIEPEAILTNPISDSGINVLNKLDTPIINCFEYMETNPLGQAEWIRFLGLLFEKKELADSLFFETVKTYNELKELTTDIEKRPTVFTELKYGDFWYMPGGKSYMAHLFADAGADYLLKEDKSTGSIPLSFESVLDNAQNADFWLFKYYSPYDMTYKQLASDYANYTLFKAYQQKNIYVCNTMTTSRYYRELPLHPDRILKDLIWIFHPELIPDYQPRYYKELKVENE